MQVASLELCRELYEVSAWSDTEDVWRYNMGMATGIVVKPKDGGRYELSSRILSTGKDVVSAYDLGYLLRKLPRVLGTIGADAGWLEITPRDERNQSGWFAQYGYVMGEGRHAFLYKGWAQSYGGTPEDAATDLAIELFKQGILKPEAQDAARDLLEHNV